MHAGWGGTGSFLVLNTLMLGDNGLQGTLPETWGSNLNNVTTLDLSQNLLSGTLPAGGLPSLHPRSAEAGTAAPADGPQLCPCMVCDTRMADSVLVGLPSPATFPLEDCLLDG